MYDITMNDEELFESLKKNSRIYSDGKYQFTFETRYFIYCFPHADKLDYVAYDRNTDQASLIISSPEEISIGKYDDMVPQILNSIKYTGDRRRTV